MRSPLGRPWGSANVAGIPSLALRLEIVLWSGTSLSRFRSVSSERRKPSVCLDARPNTKPKVTVVSMAWFEYLRCRPGFLRVGLGEFQLASLPSVSPSQTVRPLAVDLTGIEDADGLAGVSYSYQWVRVDADGLSNAVDITDATDATYTLVDADLGQDPQGAGDLRRRRRPYRDAD